MKVVRVTAGLFILFGLLLGGYGTVLAANPNGGPPPQAQGSPPGQGGQPPPGNPHTAASPPPANGQSGSGGQGNANGRSGQQGGSNASSSPGSAGQAGGGTNNAGHVWLQSAAPASDQNAERLNHDAVLSDRDPVNDVDDEHHQPHLVPCTNINLMGDLLSNGEGTYTIDSIPPSSQGSTVVYRSSWSYSNPPGGDQITSLINARTLIGNAVAAGAQAHPIQGFHFKLEFSAFPQKHKTFWLVGCPASTSVLGANLPNTGAEDNVSRGFTIVLLGAACCGLGLAMWRRGRREKTALA